MCFTMPSLNGMLNVSTQCQYLNDKYRIAKRNLQILNMCLLFVRRFHRNTKAWLIVTVVTSPSMPPRS